MQIRYIPGLAGLAGNGRPTSGGGGGTGVVPPKPDFTYLITGIPKLGHKPCSTDADVPGDRCRAGMANSTLDTGWTPDMVAKVNAGFEDDVKSAIRNHFSTGEDLVALKRDQYAAMTYIACERYKLFGPKDAVASLKSAGWADQNIVQQYIDTGTAIVGDSIASEIMGQGGGTLDAGGSTDAGNASVEGLSTGAMIGIGAGVFAVVGILALLLLKPRKK